MPATLRNLLASWLLLVLATLLISCATEKRPISVVNDPDTKKENTIPWNQQEKWEQGSEMGPMAAGTDRVEH